MLLTLQLFDNLVGLLCHLFVHILTLFIVNVDMVGL